RRQQRPVARPGRLQPLRAQPGVQQRDEAVRLAQPDRAAARGLATGVGVEQLEVGPQRLQRSTQLGVAGVGEQNGAHRGTSSRSVGSGWRIYAAQVCWRGPPSAGYITGDTELKQRSRLEGR